jgi:hypothetical protein
VRKRVPPLLLVCSLILCVLGSGGPVAVATDGVGPCDVHPLDGESTERLAKRVIRCAVRRFGPVPGDAERAICIADRESGLLPEASSPTGMYLGLYQHAAEYWDERYAEWTRPSWNLPTSALDARANAIVTIRMVEDDGGWKAAGWPVLDC